MTTPASDRAAPSPPADPAALAPAEARALFRSGLVTPTAGWSRGFTQANLVSVPRDTAYDVLLFAQRNPKPCPVLDVLDAGEVDGPLLAGDVRTDLPAYRVYVDGEMVEETPDATAWWRDDLVAEAVRVTSRYPSVHGAPVCVGDPDSLGIADLDRPDYGDPVEVRPGEVPVFWACGVTP